MSSAPESTVGPTFGRPARGTPLGDRHGLTTFGAVLLVLLVGLVGAGVDVATGSGLRLVFSGCFVGACLLAALLVRREDLRAAAVLPPLLYVVLALAGGAMEARSSTGSFLTQQALEVVNALVLGAPTLVAGTLAALVVVVLRMVGSRQR